MNWKGMAGKLSMVAGLEELAAGRGFSCEALEADGTRQVSLGMGLDRRGGGGGFGAARRDCPSRFLLQTRLKLGKCPRLLSVRWGRGRRESEFEAGEGADFFPFLSFQTNLGTPLPIQLLAVWPR